LQFRQTCDIIRAINQTQPVTKEERINMDEFTIALREAALVTVPDALVKRDILSHFQRRRDSSGVWRYTLFGHLHKVLHDHCDVEDHESKTNRAFMICVERPYGFDANELLDLLRHVDRATYRNRPNEACAELEWLVEEARGKQG
jgi:hypothetical protein